MRKCTYRLVRFLSFTGSPARVEGESDAIALATDTGCDLSGLIGFSGA
jgi:hypothetical protein